MIKEDNKMECEIKEDHARVTIYPALSLLQPWASLVVMGIKRWETRGWKPMGKPERIYIHASQSKRFRDIAATDPFKKYIPDFDRLQFGAIIGSVTLGQFYPTQKVVSKKIIGAEEIAFGDYAAGRVAWELGDPVEIGPIPMRGALSLWDPSAAIFAHMKKTINAR